MHRILVLGDIHIGDYPRYNGVVNRLSQFDKLADRLCDVSLGDEISKATDVIIAGDLLLSCVMKPKAFHCVKRFITKLCNRFNNVYYILGNHDVDIKLKRFDGMHDETLITLMEATSNFKYMHNKHEVIEGVDFYFADWIHSSEVPLTEQSDIFISHINLMPRFGQQVDNTKFKLGIFGDYHARIQVDNMITTGTPIQHYISDPIEPGVILLDIDNGTFNWKRVSIETENYQFLKIYREESAPTALGKYDVVVKAKKIVKKPEFEKLKVSLDSRLDAILEENGLSDIHSKVLSVTGDLEPIDMNFELKKLDILNFRSIAEMHVQFDEGKIIFLNGANGSGKTSFITALRVALFGDRSIKKYIRNGCDYTEVGVELLYQGRVHSIARAPGYLSYKIDDKPQDANNMASMQASIERNLPFLGYLSDFLINSHTTFFASCNRLGLISRLFGLDRYSMYFQEAAKQKSVKCDIDLKKISTEIVTCDATIKTSQTLIDESSSKIPIIDEKYKDFSLDALDRAIKIEETKLSSINCLKDKISLIKIETNPDEIQSLIESTKSDLEKSELRIKDIKDKLDRLGNLSTFKSQLAMYEELRSKNTYVATCTKCGEVIRLDISSKDITDKIKDLKVRIEDLESTLVNCHEEALRKNLVEVQSNSEVLRKKLFNLQSDQNNYILKSNYEIELNNILNSSGSIDVIQSRLDAHKKAKFNLSEKIRIENGIQSAKRMIESSLASKAELEGKLNELKEEISRYDKYLIMFSFSNPNGIPYQTLNMVVDSISDEEITFTTTKELSSGKVQFYVSCTMNVDGNDLDFDSLSDGQQAFVSLKILSKLSRCLPGLGLVMLDEPFKHIDEGRIGQCIDLLKNTQSNHIILSSHSPSFNYADRILTFSLEDGVTNVKEEL